MKQSSFIKEYTVTQNELDEFDNFSIHGILDFFQDIAGRHAQDVGVGYDSVNELGVNWILARTRFEVIKAWKYTEDIIVKTWPHKPSRFEIERDYLILNNNNEILVKGSSVWVLVDNKTNSLATTDRIYDANDIYLEEKNFPDRLKSLDLTDIKFEERYDFVVTRHELDHNHHMNNSRYGEEIDNIVKLDEHTHIKYFEIDYLSQSFLGEKIALYLHKNDSQTITGIFLSKNNEIRSKIKLIFSKT